MLKNLTSFSCFGFNSSKFDLAVLIGYLAVWAKNKELKIDVLKRGSKYFNIQVGNIIFKDVLHYSAPCSLEKYLKNWYTGPQAKSIYPYQYFKSVEEIRQCKDFPPISAFWSDLKNSYVPENDYNDAKMEFYRRRHLDQSDPDYIADFSGWLKHYQMMDVIPLTRAIENSYSCFFRYFGNNPLMFRSLPGLAFKAAFTAFDKNLPYVSTFHPSFNHVRELFRDNQYGGLVNIFHRRVVLGADGPPAAKFAPDGSPFSFFSFWDFNALYLYSQDQDLPLGSGMLWEKNSRGQYTKKPMSHEVSKGQLEWLMWLQHQDICVDSNGERQRIQHALNYGEFMVNGKPVDGYMVKDGVQYFFEYYGCFFHPGCHIPDWKIFDAEKRRAADQAKFQELSSQGNLLTHTQVTCCFHSHVFFLYTSHSLF